MPINATNIPESKNFLSPLGFKFTLNRAPNLSYNIQRTMLPGVNLDFSTVPTPFSTIPLNSRLDYNQLMVSFKVDEDLKNYLEIYNWMVELGAPESFAQYNTEALKLDANLIVMTSSMRPNISIDFFNIFPTSLSDIDFLTTDTDVNYVEASATFRYQRYSISVL